MTSPTASWAVPYGIYDVAANTGWVNVGTDHDTAAFAAASGLTITVCHLPPGTSKWNPIEHRLFSHIAMNWCGRPLRSHEVIVESIAATTTKTGLRVHAELDTSSYPTGIQVSDDEIATLPITRHRFHGDWNYSLHPRHPLDATAINSTSDQAPASSPTRFTRHSLQDPELTGMTRQQLCELIGMLAPELEAKREHVLRTRRGHARMIAPGTGTKAKLTPADRILVTVLHLRKLATMDLLGQLFGVTAMTISRAKQEVHPLLEAHGHSVSTSTARLRTPADVAPFLAPDTSKTKVKKTR